MRSRRAILIEGASALALMSTPGQAAPQAPDFPFPGGNGKRPLTKDFPQKGEMVLQRSRPPMLETPFEDFDHGVFTPNDKFFVRWHWSNIPTEIDAQSFRLRVHGQVENELSLALPDLLKFPRVEIAAVNQCSGNSRGFFEPRVAGGEWGNGAMGNARWTGVRLSDVLAKAGVKTNAVAVRFTGLDKPSVSDGPQFQKSLSLDHARKPEVMIAYAMNGNALPLLNGYPIRLVVPGWYSTYWVKMLSSIEVLDAPDENFWMKTAYLIPDTPHADIKPGQTGVTMVPINRMVPRSFITNLSQGARLKAGARAALRGLAMGGDSGVAKVEISADGGRTWQAAKLGADEGPYSFRRWSAELAMGEAGEAVLAVRCTNAAGDMQPDQANWNASGYMRNVIERTPVTLV
ncbi:MAG TPA: molybdopterin-dependent oxidoreductase [Rhizomicrobium sp.]|nr:molybdopterin-dependent oxidoreductase [Rhizomicrobium sp.]